MTITAQFKRNLASANQSGKSDMVREYEDALGDYFRARHVVAVNSGSAAIQTALTCLGAKAGCTVIVSAAAPLPTLLPIAATGARIVFADCCAGSPSIDPAQCIRLVDETVVAVVEVALWGYPQDYAPLLALLAPLGIPLVEDAAQAHGATCAGGYVGTIGKVGCFSTHDKKFLSTGEGGFLLTNDPDLGQRARRFARLGNLNGIDMGMNFKISAFTAAVGLARLAQLPEVLARKRALRLELLHHLGSWASAELGHTGEPNGYNLVLDCAGATPAWHEALAEAGIKSDVLAYGYKPGYCHPLFAASTSYCPNAVSLVGRTLQFPNKITDPEAAAQTFRTIAATMQNM